MKVTDTRASQAPDRPVFGSREWCEDAFAVVSLGVIGWLAAALVYCMFARPVGGYPGL